MSGFLQASSPNLFAQLRWWDVERWCGASGESCGSWTISWVNQPFNGNIMGIETLPTEIRLCIDLRLCKLLFLGSEMLRTPQIHGQSSNCFVYTHYIYRDYIPEIILYYIYFYYVFRISMAILSLEAYIPFSDTANSDYSDAVWLMRTWVISWFICFMMQ